MTEFVMPETYTDFVKILIQLLKEDKRVIVKKFIGEGEKIVVGRVDTKYQHDYVNIKNCYVNFVVVLVPYFGEFNQYKINLITFSDYKKGYYVDDFVSLVNDTPDLYEMFIVNVQDVEETINTFEVKEKATMLEVFTGDHVGGYKTRIFDFRTMKEK